MPCVFGREGWPPTEVRAGHTFTAATQLRGLLDSYGTGLRRRCPLIPEEQNLPPGLSPMTFALQGPLGLLPESEQLKLEADAGNGVDETSLRAVIAQLAAKTMHDHSEDLARGRVVVSGDALGEGSRGNDRVLVPHQVVEQPELGPGEAQRLAVDPQRPVGGGEAGGCAPNDCRDRGPIAVGLGPP